MNDEGTLTAAAAAAEEGTGTGTVGGILAARKTARLVGELPPPPQIAQGRLPRFNDDEDDDDDGAASSSAESEGPTEPINTEGNGLANVVLEREFEDKKKRAQLDLQASNGNGDGASGSAGSEDGNPDDADLLADYPHDTEDIELTHTRLRSLKALKLERFASHLKRLVLRQNLLTSLVMDDGTAPLEALSELEELDLYDNRIAHIKGIRGLGKLRSLDISFNLLRKVPEDQLRTLPKLQTLYMIQNKISKIEGLECIAGTLKSVEFGGNKLRTIENLESCTQLTELWFGKNKITRLQGMSTLKNLTILSIQSNRIVRLEGLEELESLEELYISHNGIKKLEGLEKNAKLRVLDIGNNFVQHLENIDHLTNLEELWANNNMLTDFPEVESQLKNAKDLDTIYLEGNPLQESMGASYRRKIMLALPQVSQIDAT